MVKTLCIFRRSLNCKRRRVVTSLSAHFLEPTCLATFHRLLNSYTFTSTDGCGSQFRSITVSTACVTFDFHYFLLLHVFLTQHWRVLVNLRGLRRYDLIFLNLEIFQHSHDFSYSLFQPLYNFIYMVFQSMIYWLSFSMITLSTALFLRSSLIKPWNQVVQ